MWDEMIFNIPTEFGMIGIHCHFDIGRNMYGWYLYQYGRGYPKSLYLEG